MVLHHSSACTPNVMVTGGAADSWRANPSRQQRSPPPRRVLVVAAAALLLSMVLAAGRMTVASLHQLGDRSHRHRDLAIAVSAQPVATVAARPSAAAAVGYRARRTTVAPNKSAVPPDAKTDAEGWLALRQMTLTLHPATAPHTVLDGPLCVFVPTDGGGRHHTELMAAAESWFDGSTAVFTTERYFFDGSSVNRGKIHTIPAAVVAKPEWDAWHAQTVLSQRSLKESRGATTASIRGRGQLSIPLFHWMAQMVKRNDPLVRNCKWFMKCDTDTFLRRELLEREVLNKLDHTQPYQVGVPLHFKTFPFNATARKIEFEYNIGGPGYTFSRGLLAAVNMEECVKSMAMDPVLLIHDDVATGYCATYHARNASATRQLDSYHVQATVRASSKVVTENLIRGDGNCAALENANATDSPSTASIACCIDAVHAIHPVDESLLRFLGRRFRGGRAAGGHDRTASQRKHQHHQPRLCRFALIEGEPPEVGAMWKLPPLLALVFEYWGVPEGRVPASAKPRYFVAKSFIDQAKGT